MRKPARTMYMHTLDNEPASFDGKDYIYYASGRSPVILVPSLRQIRREQQKEISRTRRETGFDAAKDIRQRLSYRLVRVPV